MRLSNACNEYLIANCLYSRHDSRQKRFVAKRHRKLYCYDGGILSLCLLVTVMTQYSAQNCRSDTLLWLFHDSSTSARDTPRLWLFSSRQRIAGKRTNNTEISIKWKIPRHPAVQHITRGPVKAAQKHREKGLPRARRKWISKTSEW